MNEVVDLLSGATINECWVGAKNMGGGNNIYWVENGNTVSGMWDQGQPNPTEGDCVKLDGGSSKLRMEDCATAKSFLCELF